MHDFEKLGLFYLGRQYDLEARRPGPELLLYDSKDLTTHAVCVGMTGSGKTGLCLSLLEEAAIDGIPAICIDPKGDLGNLLLTFPELRAEDFRPWLDPADAARQGGTLDELAESTAARWREGLAEWGQEPARIARFREAADVAVYTPGSQAGLPLTVLRSFAAPSPQILQDGDALRERVTSAASGLLTLLGIEADPLRSREHTLLATIIDQSWRAGRDLDLGGLIRDIQSPPFEKIGVLDLESCYPAKERFALAMQLNNLLASPGFAGWMQGEPLDVGRLLHTPAGKPRISILSIAHLSDAERMFFVTLLLNEVVAWMRAQSGTSSLRAILYMDEIFGYFPPTANPPSKTPLLTLMKQARAYGLGVVLATQNPVDLDYKGLSNAGTWLLGRLQTERDKARVLDGLEGASAAAGATFDRARVEQTLSSLGQRVFLMNNVHEDEPVVFQTRWALSYLRGPLTRDQIAALMQPRKQAGTAPVEAPPRPAVAAGGDAATTHAPLPLTTTDTRPLVSPDVSEVFLSPATRPGERLEYRPAVLAAARVHFVDAKSGIDHWEEVHLLCPVDADVPDVDWSEADALPEEPRLDEAPDSAARFAELPASLTRPKTYDELAKSLKNHLYREHRLTLFKSALLKQTSRPGESEADFRVRLAQAAHEYRDEQLEKLRGKYAPKLAALEERYRKAQQRVEKEKSQAGRQTWQAALSFGSSILGAVFGRKLASSTNVNRAATSMRAAGRAADARGDIAHAEETAESVEEKLAALEAEFASEMQTLETGTAPNRLELAEVELKPRKADIAVSRVSLAWMA